MSGLPGGPGVFTAAEALDVARDEFGLGFADHIRPRPVLVVDVTQPTAALYELSRLTGSLPCVVVGVADGAPEPPDGFDVLVSTVGASRPWVHSEDPVATAAMLAAKVEKTPLAAVALAQLLRFATAVPVEDAVVAESFVYSMLQSGPEFRAWLDTRERPSGRSGGDGDPVVVERDGEHLEIELNRPSVRNALNAAMRDGLVTALQLVAADPTIATARLSGRGPAFCSGGDLTEFGSFDDPATSHAVRVSRSVGLRLARCADRVEVHVHGPCVGAGIEIPAFSHRVVASGDASFSLPEVAFGLIPGAGGTASVPRRIGRHRTAYAALSGAAIDVRQALEWGLVDQLSD
jgi:hypothetical protein